MSVALAGLDEAAVTADESRRRDLTGIQILPIADFTFLKDVARESPRDARRAGF